MIEAFDQNLITQLFQNNDNSVYKLDLILQQYSEYNTSSQFVVDLETFFKKNINSYSLIQEYLSDINILISNPYTNNPIKINRSPLNRVNVIEKTLAIDVSYNSSQNKSAFNNNQNPNAALSVVNDLQKKDIINNCSNTTFYDNYCNNYMLKLFASACFNKFSNNQLLDQSFLQTHTNPSTNPTDLVSAINEVKNLFSSKSDIFTINFSNLLQNQLNLIIAASPTININLIYDLNPGKFNNQLFYKLKNSMVLATMVAYNNVINNIKYTDTTTIILPYNSNTQKFTLTTYNANLLFAQMAVDLYIKSSYPIVHFCLIDSLLKQYKIRGDFINIRLGYLAKLNYSYKFANYIEVINNSKTKVITSNINNYFLALKDLTPTNLNDQLKTVHDLSNQVQNISENIKDLTAKVDNDKIMLKNLIVNNEALEKKLWWRKFWFWYLFWWLLVQIIFIGILLFINNNKFGLYALWHCISIIIFLLLIKIIQFILNVMSKN